MNGDNPEPPSPTDALHPTAITLDPIRTDGADALAPDTPDDIASVKLVRLDLLWENAFHQVTSSTADDIFRCHEAALSHEEPLPKGAEPVRVILDIQFADAPSPHSVEIVPPNNLSLECPADAPRVISFLAKRHFTIARKLASLLVLLLALAGAIIPDLDDDDDDDNDDETSEPHIHFAT